MAGGLGVQGGQAALVRAAVFAQLGLGQHLARPAGGAWAFHGARAGGRRVATAGGQHNTIHPTAVFPHPHIQRVNAGSGQLFHT